jgi:hypothetical protein
MVFLDFRWVEPGALLGQVRRWERDGDPAVRPFEAGVTEGGPQPVTGLEHRRVAKADDHHRRQPTADVDLHADRVGGQADQRGGRQPGEHG